MQSDEATVNWTHAVSSGTGGFLSSVTEGVLHSYNPTTNKWNTQLGPIIGKAIIGSGYFGSALGTMLQNEIAEDFMHQQPGDSPVGIISGALFTFGWGLLWPE